MTIALIILAFLISFAGIVLVNISSGKAKSIREKLIIKHSQEFAPTLGKQKEIFDLINKLDTRQAIYEGELVKLRELINSFKPEFKSTIVQHK